MPQKPPFRTYMPPLCVPASAWPAVAPSTYGPPVLNVIPPPSMLFQRRL